MNEVAVDLNMFESFVKGRIRGQVDCSLVVTDTMAGPTSNSYNMECSQVSSLGTIESKGYSASANDLLIICCFLVFQDRKESPRKTMKPIVDLQESRHPAQSTSAKAWCVSLQEAKNKRP